MQQTYVSFGIAEDEPIENMAMCQFIENSFPEAKVLWREEDGERALAAVRKDPPQILIVDIHMPVMDGLSMCEALYRDGYDGVILINTAFDSFAYAKRAITLKAYDYIVKPVDNKELYTVLSNCIAEARRRAISRVQQQSTTQAMRSLGQLAVSLLSKAPQANESSVLCLETLGWTHVESLSTHVVHIHSSQPLDSELILALEKCLGVFTPDRFLLASDFVDDRHMIALIQPRRIPNRQAIYTQLWAYGALCARLQGLSIRISGPCADEAAISLECTASESGNASMSMPPRTWRILQKKEADKLCRTVERLLYDAQYARIERCFHESLRSHPGDELHWELFQWLLTAALQVWPTVDFLPAVKPLYELYTTPQACLDGLLAFCKHLPVPEDGNVIDRALRIMETQYDKDISQSALAERLGLDQGYFCRLFKRKTGRNFSEVLMEIRMQHAEALLRQNPKLSLEELCNSCGLTSKTYFSEAFKKWKGMTITQFLKTLSA